MSIVRSRRVVGAVAVGSLLSASCSVSAAGPLSLTAKLPSGDSLQIDERCVPACAGDEKVEVVVKHTTSGAVQHVDVDLVQYRVDYAVDGVTVPFYGGKIGLPVAPGQERVMSLVVVGAAQRSAVWQAAASAPVTGSATLTIAGYDGNNEQIFLATTFAVRFGAIAASGAADAPK